MVDFRNLRSGPAEFWFMRHGHSAGNLEGVAQGLADYPLTEQGRLQAREAGQWLRDRGIDAVLSSPLSRATETARILAEETGAGAPCTVPELTEIDIGVLTGVAWARIPPHLAGAYRDFRLHGWEGVEGSEKAERLAARAEAAWAELRRRYAEGRRGILAVTHSGFLQWIVRATFGHGAWMPLLDFEANCGLTCLRVENEPIGDGRFTYYAKWTHINARPWDGRGPTGTA